jgi:hypothetical protein
MYARIKREVSMDREIKLDQIEDLLATEMYACLFV